MTLFACDEVSIPFTRGLKLAMRAPQRHPANPVVRRGPPGAPDSWAVRFYGSVLREQGKFRMWYVAVGDERLDRSTPRSAPWRVAYAESEDGVQWTKPRLGLVEYRGNRDNNLVLAGVVSSLGAERDHRGPSLPRPRGAGIPFRRLRPVVAGQRRRLRADAATPPVGAGPQP